MLIKLHHLEWKTAHKSLDLFFLIIRSWSASLSLFLPYIIQFLAVKFLANILYKMIQHMHRNSLNIVRFISDHLFN